MNNKFVEVSDAKGLFLFDCPACQLSHFVNTNPEHGAVWEFNNDLENPTVSPSIFVNKNSIHPTDIKCHSFIKDGFIQFLNDCTHSLAGQTVKLPNLD